MSKLRSVNTKFWDDTFIVDLDPKEKLLFLYLITNSLTNLLGIYEISIRKISFDTGLTPEMVQKGLERFERKSVEREFDELPNRLKDNILGNGSEGLPNDYRMIRKGLETISDLNRIKSNIIEDEFNISDDSENSKKWKDNFEVYKDELKEKYEGIISDSDFIKDQEKYHPGVDIKLSIEKAYKNFWATEAGWKNKKNKKSKDINWKLTFINAIDLNKVYKPKNNSSGFNPADTRTQPDMENFNGNF